MSKKMRQELEEGLEDEVTTKMDSMKKNNEEDQAVAAATDVVVAAGVDKESLGATGVGVAIGICVKDDEKPGNSSNEGTNTTMAGFRKEEVTVNKASAEANGDVDHGTAQSLAEPVPYPTLPGTSNTSLACDGRSTQAVASRITNASATTITTTTTNGRRLQTYPGAFAMDGPGLRSNAFHVPFTGQVNEHTNTSTVDEEQVQEHVVTEAVLVSHPILDQSLSTTTTTTHNNASQWMEQGLSQSHTTSHTRHTLPNSSGGSGYAVEVIQGTLMKTQDGITRRNSKRGWLCVVFGSLLAATLLILLLVFLVGGVDTNDANPNTQEIPNMDMEDDTSSIVTATDILEIFPPFTTQQRITPAVAKLINETGSSYYWANRWMLHDPNLAKYSNERQWQRFVMVAFYHWTNGPHWFQQDNWLSYDIIECNWTTTQQKQASPSVLCNDQHQLTYFNMSHNNLTGEFPFVGDFTPTIQHFDISFNNLGGPMPVMAYQEMDDLETYVISGNHFENRFVASFSSFKLKDVRTDGNQLFGSAHGVYQYLPDLEVLDNSYNFYDGHLTSEVGRCTKLIELNNAGNLYHGPIPSEIGKLTLLQHYNVSNNQLVNSTIPSELGLLTNLAQLDLSGTQLTGPIPAPLCKRAREGSLQIVANCSLVQCCSQDEDA